MSSVAWRDLRNYTADVLRAVSGGATVTLTVNGSPVAEIRPIRSVRPRFLTKADLIDILATHQADAGLTSELQDLGSETTDDLDEP